MISGNRTYNLTVTYLIDEICEMFSDVVILIKACLFSEGRRTQGTRGNTGM
jgi:hypothetical protein